MFLYKLYTIQASSRTREKVARNMAHKNIFLIPSDCSYDLPNFVTITFIMHGVQLTSQWIYSEDIILINVARLCMASTRMLVAIKDIVDVLTESEDSFVNAWYW